MRNHSVAMGMKRPNLIHPNPYIADCAKVLKSSEDSLQSDTFLCRWTQLQVLADDLAAQISSEEDTVLSVRESKARSAYNVFKKQVTAWESHSLSGDKPRESIMFLMPNLLSPNLGLKEGHY